MTFKTLKLTLAKVCNLLKGFENECTLIKHYRNP